MGNKASRQIKKGGKMLPQMLKFQSPFGPRLGLKGIKPTAKS